MNFKKKFLPFLIIAIFLITACGKISIPTNANTAFRNFTLCFFQQEVASNTINLHYSLQEPTKYGIVDFPITLGSYDMSEVATLASIENWESALHKFSPNALSEENKLTYDILSHYFETLRQDVSYHLYQEPLSPVTGIHAQLPVLLAEYQLNDKKDAETYLSLLKTLPNYFASLARFEQQKSSVGLFMSDAVADEVIAQCNAFVAMGDENYLLSTFEERVGNIEKLTPEEQKKLIQENKDTIKSFVLPAYESLAGSIASLKGTGTNTQGLCEFPEGKEYYSHLVASETGSNRSISELKELINAQILTDLQDSQKVLSENPNILEEADAITESPENILQTLESKISNTFPSAADVNVNIKYVPTALEEYLSPAFYLIPAIDNFSENTIYINQGHSLTDINLFTTLAHEGYPGHLYQTTYFANTDPDPVRSLLSYSGYVEGWATYAEMCSYYLSPLSKPHASLLQKNNSIILGLYAVADIGIHYDGWSLEDTVEHFATYGIDDEAVIADIYNYILGDPANYLKYYVGYVEILELKKDYMKQQGEDFSQKEFHKELLEVGPAPFEVVRKYMIK
jgi:uncharacterized protein (DUF885 family)